MADQKPVAQTVEISTEQFAFMCGVDIRTVQYVIQKGFISRVGRGQLDLAGAMRGWTLYMESKVTEATKRAAGNEVSRARAAEIAQRTELKARTLVPIADAFAIVDGVLAAFRQDLDGFPAWATREPAERRRLEGRMNEINAAAVARLEKIRSGLGAGDPADAPAAPAAPGRVGLQESNVPAKRGRARAA